MEPLITDTSLIQTPVYNGQSRFSRRKKDSYTFSKINPPNADTVACPIGVRINGVAFFFIIENAISLKNARQIC